jgi:hypothetical protein
MQFVGYFPTGFWINSRDFSYTTKGFSRYRVIATFDSIRGMIKRLGSGSCPTGETHARAGRTTVENGRLKR